MDNTTRYTASILLIGGGLILFDGFLVLKEQNYVNLTTPILLILAGTLVFVLGILFGTEKISVRASAFMERITTPMRIRQEQLTLLVMSVILSFMVHSAAGIAGNMVNPFLALIAWSAALVLVVAGSWKKGEAGKLPEGASLLTRLETPLTLTGIFIFALILRIIQPET